MPATQPVMPRPTCVGRRLTGSPGLRGDEVAAERDGHEVVVLAEEDSTVVVVDEQPELVGHREPDLLDVVQPRELPREALKHFEVRDRAHVVSADALFVGTFARALVEGHHEPLPAGLRRHHRRLRAGDELARVGGVLGADGDPGRDRELADGLGLEQSELDADALGERGGAPHVAGREDHCELLAADAADDVCRADGRAQDVGYALQEVVADAVAVDVVHLLEVVEIEHHDRDSLVGGGCSEQLLAESIVERAVVVETRQCVGLRLVLETRADVGVVDGESGRVAEALRQEELLIGERGLFADAVDVERPLELSACDERDGDERLGLDGRAGHEAHAWIEVGLVGEDRLAMVDRPAGDPFAERERLAHDLVGPVAARQDRAELALRLVCLVDVHVLVRDQHRQRVRDALEQCTEALLREDVVEDLGQPAIRLGRAARDEADVRPVIRLDGCRVGHVASDLIGWWRSPLESGSAKITRAWRRARAGILGPHERRGGLRRLLGRQ